MYRKRSGKKEHKSCSGICENGQKTRGYMRRSRKNRRMILILIIFVGLLMCITVAAGHRQQVKLRAGEERIRSLQQEMEQEQARTEEIRELKEYVQSDEYIEQIAKDKLGLISDDDIIFKESGR